MKLALDCDGPLLADRTPLFFRWAASELDQVWDYGVHVRTGKWLESTGHQKPHISQLYEQYISSGAMPADRLTVGAAEAISQIAGDKYLVTARNATLRLETLKILLAAYGSFTRCYWGTDGCKDQHVGEIGADVVVEDNIREVLAVVQLTNPPAKVFLFPVRNCQRIERHSGLDYLDAESMVTAHMSDTEWDAVTTAAWQQIADEILSLQPHHQASNHPQKREAQTTT